jgi:hypothetical protein
MRGSSTWRLGLGSWLREHGKLKDLLQLPQITKAIIHKGDDQVTKLS